MEVRPSKDVSPRLFTMKVLQLFFTLSLFIGLQPLMAQSGAPGGPGSGRQMPPYSQRPAIGSISGLVMDSSRQEPLGFATIALYLMPQDSLVNGGISDETGNFQMNDVRLGMYRAEVAFLGYEAKQVDRVVVRPNRPEVELGQIWLQESSQTLEAVEISAERSYMEISIDRKVFNISKDLNSVGGDAMDALRNIPSLEVDVEGGITLRGSSNVNVLIDGKPSSLTGADRAALLEQLPASSIETIEVITNPSARFDPDGTAGILNIVLKKDRKKGLSGSINAGVGTNSRYNASASINYRTEDINLSANYGYRKDQFFSRRSTFRETFFDDSISILDQNFTGDGSGASNNVRLSLDWYLSPKSTLTVGGRFNTRTRDQIGVTSYDFLDVEGFTTDLSFQDEVDDNAGWSSDIDLRYEKEFKNRDHKFIFDSRYSFGSSDDLELVTFSDAHPDGTLLDAEPFVRNTEEFKDNSVTTLEATYIHPKIVQTANGEEEKWRIETGAKAILRNVETDYQSSIFDTLEQVFVDDTLVSNQFNLSEQILSIYGTYKRSWGSWGFQAGLRLEAALTAPQTINPDSTYDNDYRSAFPSLHISKDLGNRQELQWSYSRRINRPSRWALNPFVDVTDPLNIRIGNPDLNPEYIHSAEMGYTKMWQKGHVLTSSLFFRHTDDVIRSVREVDSNGVGTSIFQNLGWQRSYGLEIIAVANIFDWWRLTASGTVQRQEIDGTAFGQELSNSNIGWNVRAGSFFTLPWDMMAQVNMRYRGPGITLQGEFQGYLNLDIALRKDLFDDQLTVSLRVSDVLDQRQFGYTSEGRDFFQESEFKRQSRIGWLTLSYKFGRQNFDRRNRGSGDYGGGDFDMGGGEF